MWEKEFIEGAHVRCKTGWINGEDTNSFEITFVCGVDSESYPRYDIWNATTNEWYEGCYLQNGEWEPIWE
jgi:hypothetical protein